jgi:hypothetical protein
VSRAGLDVGGVVLVHGDLVAGAHLTQVPPTSGA